MSDDALEPHDDLTPLRVHQIADPKAVTTRVVIRCKKCGTENECPPCPPPVVLERVTSALVAKHKDPEVYPFPQGAETKILRVDKHE